MTSPEQLGLSPDCETVKLAIVCSQCAGPAGAKDADWREFCRRHLTVCDKCASHLLRAYHAE